MHAWNYFPMLAQLLFLLSLYNPLHTAASWERCSTDSNFTTNSTYHSNLNLLLLPSLTSATVSSGYANRSAGRSPDQVFGLALCQLDVSQDKCEACLATAVDTLRSRCPSAKDAATWGDHCFLAYSNTYFSNDSDKSSFSQILYNVGVVSEPSRFVDLVGDLMNALINWAAYKTDRMFATGEANFTSVTNLYGLVQCTRDQSDDDCFQCLRQSLASMQSCCLRNQGGVVLKYRCYLRYETYQYYNMSVPAAPLPPLPSEFSAPPPPRATANPPPPPAVGDSNSSSFEKWWVPCSSVALCSGYIAPEYALHRRLSDKSDVYSYGVLVLEIITGRRISEFRGSGHRANLQTYAWKYWNKGKALQIVDQNFCGRFQREEALRCIRTALLCVQDNPSKRPAMASVVFMLSSSSMTTPSPSAPAFLIERSSTTDSNESTRNSSPEIKNKREGSSTSINEVSITVMEPRQ
ncbi:hypothetical protein BHE74_00027606 [Ensete ventricosum]|nr:hypothetical protein GW17_00050933 [Ensete ventricosum]RWW65108.1 hypothetical protein BHE74_00027606 [Ensete ventricosum]